MALTLDQTETLQTAIDNLNQSVQVNKEVLEIVKSVGNTGAVDIATHNNDLDAHPAFNNVNVKQVLSVNRSSASDHSDVIAEIRFQANSSGIGFDSYRNDDEVPTGTSIRAVSFKNDYTQHNESQTLQTYMGIQAREMYKDSGTLKWQTLGSIVFQEGNGNLPFMNITLYDHNDARSRYNFYRDKLSSADGSDLGSSTFQWKDLYLQNSPIVSSDERLKQDIADVPEAVFRAWGRVGFKQYRFKEAVEKKGSDARLHVGVIAQQILAAFEAEGLDATKYGIVCHDEWDDQYWYETVTDAEAVLDEKGKVITPEKTHQEKRFVKAAGDVWTVRYEEALALETAYQRWRLSKIEAALAAKGITL